MTSTPRVDTPRRCRTCDNPMPDADRRRRYCSPRCRAQSPERRAAASARAALRSRELRTARSETWPVCVYCGVPYLPIRAGQKCPAEECKKDSKSMATSSHGGAERVRNTGKGGKTETVAPLQVFQRDNWTCHICNQPTSRDIRDRRRPDSPTLDHVVPVEKGGAHTYENIRTAHFYCNGVRGSRSVEDGRQLVFDGKGAPRAPGPLPTRRIKDYLAFGIALSGVPRQWEGGPPVVRRLGGLD